VGTGNFNEDTARLYTDMSLLTCDKRITREVESIFQFYNNNYKTGAYKDLAVSPFNMRKKFITLINKEIEFAQKGKHSQIILKMNSLVDEEMIQKLYEASNAGVQVKLIIRSICSLICGVKGMSENIQAISIVDRLLEHSRVFIFSNDGNEKIFISSADWMLRNLDFRSEVAVPIYDKDNRAEIKHIVNILWNDNTKARVLNKQQDNQFRSSYGKSRVRSQEDVYKFLRGSAPKVI
jgi:polyphosphate kinase